MSPKGNPRNPCAATDVSSAGRKYSTDDRMSEMIQTVVEPIALRYLHQRFQTFGGKDQESEKYQDLLDLLGDIKVSMITAIRRFSLAESEGQIDSIESYTATVARNKFNEYIRAKYPNRFRLKNQLRYIFAKAPAYRLVRHEGAGWICGLSEKVGSDEAGIAECISLNGRQPQIERSLADNAVDAKEIDLTRLVGIVLKELNALVDFDEFVALIAEIRGIKEATFFELSDEIAVASRVTPPAVELDRKTFMIAVWNELLRLPIRHRRALLLHFADDGNDNMLILFPAMEIASIRGIARALEMNAEEFAAIWNRLPLPDIEIAKIMGLERQQVINLRQSARNSLKRRLTKKSIVD